MALFGKKLSLEDILKAIEGLSDEEKAQVKAKMGEEKPVEEVEEKTEEVVEETNDNEETIEEKTEEIPEETGEEVVETEGVEQTTEPTEQPVEPPKTEELNAVEEENKEDVLQGIMEKLTALEEKLSQFDELKSLMEDYTKKQADSIGYKGAVPGAKKNIQDMSADELKNKMLNGEI